MRNTNAVSVGVAGLLALSLLIVLHGLKAPPNTPPPDSSSAGASSGPDRADTGPGRPRLDSGVDPRDNATAGGADRLLRRMRDVIEEIESGRSGKWEEMIPHLVEFHRLTLDPSKQAQAVGVLISAVESPAEDPEFRRILMLLLGGLPDPRGRATLKTLACDPDDRIAFQALKSLGLIPIDVEASATMLDDPVDLIEREVYLAAIPPPVRRQTSLFWEFALIEIAADSPDSGYGRRIDSKYTKGSPISSSSSPYGDGYTFFQLSFADLQDEDLVNDAAAFIASRRDPRLRIGAMDLVITPGYARHPTIAGLLANIAMTTDEQTDVRWWALIELGGDRSFRRTQGTELGERVIAAEFARPQPDLKVLDAAFNYIQSVGSIWLFTPGIKESWDRYWEMRLEEGGNGITIENRMTALAGYGNSIPQAEQELLDFTRRDDRWDLQRPAIVALIAQPRDDATLKRRFAHLADCAEQRPLRAAALAVEVLADFAGRLQQRSHLRLSIESLRGAVRALESRSAVAPQGEASDARPAIERGRAAIHALEARLQD